MQTKRPFRKIMVVNRGEIATRVFRAATELGLTTVGVYSFEDRLSFHRYKADEAWQIGEPGEPLSAYLDMDAIIHLAKKRNVDAIHPGYGFLAENAHFAEKCDEAGIVFVGPPAKVIHALGDKLSARQIAQDAGVPVIPGTKKAIEKAEAAVEFAASCGYPVMLKAAFGGGGRGMRRCDNAEQLGELFAAAKREAQNAFGRGEIFIEKFVENPRHIEVQILADGHGNIFHLFERDCSIQRRHQKVVEVAPALNLSNETRQKLYDAAIRVARQVGLVNAATVEFLVEPNGDFFFIEVNPRLQVEHTITELLTGIDIVQAQIRIAEGASLNDDTIGIQNQESIVPRGAAIQARITTEDPKNNFAPDTGRLTAYRSAAGFGIRLDPGVSGAGAIVTPHYDSLLVKVSAYGLTHKEASRKLLRSLAEFRIRGVATNIPFLEKIVQHSVFQKGEASTHFVETTPELFVFPRRRNRATRLLRALGETIVNGPPGVDAHLERPAIRMVPVLPPRIQTHEDRPESPKQILDAKGPDAVVDWVRGQKKLLLTDTTFRDAHQSLLATRVRSQDLGRVARATEDRLANAFSVECWGGATFDVAFRFLREDPWDRLAMLRDKMPNTLLQMLLRGSNAVGYTNYPENVVRRFVQLAAETGVDVFRIFDCFNQLSAMKASIEEVRAAGKIAEVSICFTGDLHDPERPLYNLDYYRRKANECAEAGAHMLAIKDMAGLLKPNAAPELVDALRSEVNLPIHLHTHDTSGNGVATVLAAADAGVDIADVAIASMSGLTSQPSMDAVVAAMVDTERSPGLDSEELQELSDYWEAIRTWYAPFESGLRSSTADVYRHEIPGGQYSNLKPQAMAVGLSEQWGVIRERYREVNFAFGDLIKVTPSSKVVGDFSLWLSRNELSVEDYLNSDTAYDVPQSVIGFFEGAIGQPEGGFPARLRERVLGTDASKEKDGAPALELPDFDFQSARNELVQLSTREVTDQLVVSYALYPRVVRDYLKYRKEYGDTSVLDTETFLYGAPLEKEIVADIEEGKSLIVRHKTVGQLRDDNTREVHFNMNGAPRSVFVKDRSVSSESDDKPKADATNPNEVGAPMPGTILSVAVGLGDTVEEGDALAVVEAMKLETTIRASTKGNVTQVLVKEGTRVEAGDLIFVLGS
jgi:pyruvate carboxylase